MIRLFVGLALPEPVSARLGTLAVGIPGVRWIETRNLHMTLRFIGDVEDGLAREIHDDLAEAIRGPALDLAITGFGTFGSRQPHSLWVGVEKTPELARVQARIEAAATRAGLVPEPRKFTPHITLARLKDAHMGRVREFLAGHSPLSVAAFTIDHVTLFRSLQGRGGAEYEALAEYPLTG